MAQHAYYPPNRDRTVKPEISMIVSTPYEHCMIDARAKYDEALPIILGEFLTKENINKIVANSYDENIAKYLKEYIKTATLKNKISENILEKSETNLTSSRIKI